jgi:hypothetical protein
MHLAFEELQRERFDIVRVVEAVDHVENSDFGVH